MERFLVGGLILAHLGHNLVWAEPYYAGMGKNVTLKPPPGSDSRITSVVWRHFEDFAAEWSSGDAAVELYRDFKGRTVLNTTTGYLFIDKMRENESGMYSVEINGKKLNDKYEVKVIEEVPTPKIWPKPGTGDDQREFVCEGDVNKAGPVTYWWDTTKDASWIQLDQKITLLNNETTRGIDAFSCKMVNPLGEKKSKPVDNPFFPKPSDHPALGALALIPILGVLGGLAFWKRDAIKKRLRREEPTGNPNATSPEESEQLKPVNADQGPRVSACGGTSTEPSCGL